MKKIVIVCVIFTIGIFFANANVYDHNSMSASQCEEYGKNLFEKGQYVQALPFIKKAAEAGYKDAHYMYAWMHENGKAVSVNYSIAMREYLKAKEKGCAKASNALGLMYENEKGVAKNLKQAADFYKQAADRGYIYGLRNLANCYEYGKGVEVNYYKAAQNYWDARDNSTDTEFRDETYKFWQRANSKRKDIELKSKQNKTKEGSIIPHIHLIVSDFKISKDYKETIDLQSYGRQIKLADIYHKSDYMLIHFDPDFSGIEEKIKFYNRHNSYLHIIDWRSSNYLVENIAWSQYHEDNGDNDDYNEEFGVRWESFNENCESVITKSDFAVLVDSVGKIIWRGSLIDNVDGKVIINKELENKLQPRFNALKAEVISKFNVLDVMDRHPLCITREKNGYYEMSFYDEPQFLPKGFLKEDFTSQELSALNDSAYVQFNRIGNFYSALAPTLNSGPVVLGTFSKDVLFSSTNNTFLVNKKTSKYDDLFLDLSKRYKESPIIRNRLYFLRLIPMQAYQAKEITGQNEEEDLRNVRLYPSELNLKKFIDSYPNSEHIAIIQEMYNFHITEIKGKESNLKKN